MKKHGIFDFTRRDFIKASGLLAASSLFTGGIPSWVFAQNRHPQSISHIDSFDLTIAPYEFSVGGRNGGAVAINGTIPGPLVRLQEGREVILKVKNLLNEPTSIHWHGLILPPEMDGVPGVSFKGIDPGQTFIYRFPVKQSGTYWYHSHSGGQEQLGVYGPIIIDPTSPEPYKYERDYIVVLSDWSFESPMSILANLKSQASYYNYQKRTIFDLVKDARNTGVGDAIKERLMWNGMNMDPTDIADVTGSTYSYLLNGFTSDETWTGIFKVGERIRLRFIGAAAMTLFDVRIPGLVMSVVQADGQDVQKVEVEEFRIAPGEAYDVIVTPTQDIPYTIFAEPIDRSGFALGTLATRHGLKGPIPERRRRPVRSMKDMGMGGHSGHTVENFDSNRSHTSATHSNSSSSLHSPNQEVAHSSPQIMTHEMNSQTKDEKIPWSSPVKHGDDHHGPGNSSIAEYSQSRLSEPGIGLDSNTRRVLVYTDLRRTTPTEDTRQFSREIELHLTGNMERYVWSIDGKKYSEAKEPIRFSYGERLRLTFVNDTMMEHPMHLHGMWMELENGQEGFLPRKHTIVVKPAEKLSVLITADAPGKWAFHCHLLLHMEMGMFRVVEVSNEGELQ